MGNPKTIDMTPTFETTVTMCILMLDSGTTEAREFAIEELTRYGRALDALKAAGIKLPQSQVKGDPA